MKLNIKSYINTNVIDEAAALTAANTLVEQLSFNKLVKLYYILPASDRIIIIVSAANKAVLEIDDNVLYNDVLSTYKLASLPPQILDYQEFLVRKSLDASTADTVDMAQSLLENRLVDGAKKIPIIKVDNYGTEGQNTLVFPTIFANTFASDMDFVSTGDSSNGATLLVDNAE